MYICVQQATTKFINSLLLVKSTWWRIKLRYWKCIFSWANGDNVEGRIVNSYVNISKFIAINKTPAFGVQSKWICWQIILQSNGLLFPDGSCFISFHNNYEHITFYQYIDFHRLHLILTMLLSCESRVLLPLFNKIINRCLVFL